MTTPFTIAVRFDETGVSIPGIISMGFAETAAIDDVIATPLINTPSSVTSENWNCCTTSYFKAGCWTRRPDADVAISGHRHHRFILCVWTRGIVVRHTDLERAVVAIIVGSDSPVPTARIGTRSERYPPVVADM